MVNSSNAVEIKGYGNNIVIILSDEGNFSDIETELIKRLEGSDQFFSGAKVVLDLGNRILNLDACRRLKEILSDRFNLSVANVRSRVNETRKSVVELGWKIESRKRSASILRSKIETTESEKLHPRVERTELVVEESTSFNDTILIKGTLRSGQKKRHRGNVVIIGDVNPGAEVVATGDIVVIGTLRGVAHAGVEGDITTRIIALDLQPIQLRIAGYIGRSPDLNSGRGTFPEVAGVEDGNIVIRKLK